jgi:hypothetical protein
VIGSRSDKGGNQSTRIVAALNDRDTAMHVLCSDPSCDSCGVFCNYLEAEEYERMGMMRHERTLRKLERAARKSKGRDRRIVRFIGALFSLSRLPI